MEVLEKLTAWVEQYRKPALAGVGTLFVFALMLALLAPGRSTDYQSIALLLYAGNAAAAPGTPALSAIDAAKARFNDAQLIGVIQQFDLYPELRQEHPDEQVAAHMRERMSLLQADSYSLQIAFRDDNSERSQEVANALAESLQTDVLARADMPAAAAPLPLPTQHKKIRTPPRVDDPRRQLARVNADLAALTGHQSELQEKSSDKQRQIAAAGSKSTTAKPAEPEPAADPNAAARATLREQLAIEKQQLATLQQRYTEAYPDVIDAHEQVSQLESKLAALPPAPAARRTRSLNLYQKEVDDLTVQESEIGEQLRSNERQLDELQRRRADLLQRISEHSPAATSTTQDITAPTATTAAVTPALLSAAQQVHPFHILQAATMSIAVGTVKATRFTPPVLILAGLGCLALLVLFFLPRIPRKDLVITTPDQLRKSLPDHVIYLGDVYGSDH